MVYLINKTIAVFGGITLVGLAALGIGFGVYLTQATSYRGGVVTNGHECAEIGGNILKKGGSAVDAAVAALFCEGVAMPQSMGLGGGFLMTIYERETGKTRTLNAREIAPKNAYEDMFKKNATLATKGGLATAVPAELKGYWYVHQEFGKLPWADLVRPTIELCKKGHLVTTYLEKMFKGKKEQIRNSPTMSEIYINKATNSTYKNGELVKRTDLVDFLETVAVEGADALYNGTYTRRFVNDVNSLGGNMTVEDMQNYKPEWLDPISVNLPFGHTLYTVGLPGSGVILSFILNILKGYIDISAPDSVQTHHRIVESFKYGYGKRTELGDPHYVDMEELVSNLTSETYAAGIRQDIWDNRTFSDPKRYGANTSLVEDHGTAHISILAPNGDAVSVTSTINLLLGAMVRSPSTGIILNNEMDDFSSPYITNSFGMPPSPANYIRPGKRPLSSMVPTIVTDSNKDARLVIGAAGGTKITTSVALVTIRHLWFNQTLKDAVFSKRFHHQLFPMLLQVENDFDEDIVQALLTIGHNCSSEKADGFSSLTAVAKVGDTIQANYDPRRSGSIVLL